MGAENITMGCSNLAPKETWIKSKLLPSQGHLLRVPQNERKLLKNGYGIAQIETNQRTIFPCPSSSKLQLLVWLLFPYELAWGPFYSFYTRVESTGSNSQSTEVWWLHLTSLHTNLQTIKSVIDPQALNNSCKCEISLYSLIWDFFGMLRQLQI